MGSVDPRAGMVWYGVRLPGWLQVAKVVGVDSIAASIEDAVHNAALNGITNAEFVCGKAEDALPLILAKHAAAADDVVAVVDPPRAGLHKSVVRALLACKALKRLVYVSCNPDTLADNMVQLCTPPRPGARAASLAGP